MLVTIIPIGMYYYSQRYVINCGRDANLECWESTLKPVKGLQASGRQEGTDYREAHFKRKNSCLNEGVRVKTCKVVALQRVSPEVNEVHSASAQSSCSVLPGVATGK